MRILLGTTNPSKVKRFSDLLKGYDVEFVTLKDLAITDEPEENGTTLEENAIAKAKFYGQYFDVVICNDSGLYFEELTLNDVRQPIIWMELQSIIMELATLLWMRTRLRRQDLFI